MPSKKAELAGSWYDDDPRSLRATVDVCLEEARTKYAGALAAGTGRPTAIVVPHAGLAYSGTVAAAAYLLLRDGFPDVETLVLFGACHRHRLTAPAVWDEGSWETPLGDVGVDAELAAELVRAGGAEANRRAHHGDNALELQLPFIKRLFPEARIAPVAMGFFPDSARFGALAAAAAERLGRKAAAVASTDLTHYGTAFGVMPAGSGRSALEWTADNDNRFLETLVDMRLDDIVPTAARDGSACGAGAAAAAAGWADARGCRRGRLLAHTNSYEIAPKGPADHMVGYAALAYESAEDFPRGT